MNTISVQNAERLLKMASSDDEKKIVEAIFALWNISQNTTEYNEVKIIYDVFINQLHEKAAHCVRHSQCDQALEIGVVSSSPIETENRSDFVLKAERINALIAKIEEATGMKSA